MIFNTIRPLVLMAALAFAGAAAADQPATRTVTVFAASSLQTALDRIGALFSANGGGEVVLVYGASSTLSRQIASGAPADVFVSANVDWMDALTDKGLLLEGSRRDLLTNRLVLIGADGPPIALDDTLPSALGAKAFVAMAEVGSVPAGIYGKAALESLGLWAAIEPRVVQTDNVRAATALVRLGEADFGIVYASDAAAEAGVSVRAEFDPATHPPILYPAAAIAGRNADAALALLEFLTSPEAAEIFAGTGFGVVR